jgi:hypothetical protein
MDRGPEEQQATPTEAQQRPGRLRRLRRCLTYSNVMSMIAGFFAVGGAGYTATTLPRNSVGTKQLKPGAAHGSDIHSGALHVSDLAVKKSRRRRRQAERRRGIADGPQPRLHAGRSYPDHSACGRADGPRQHHPRGDVLCLRHSTFTLSRSGSG